MNTTDTQRLNWMQHQLEKCRYTGKMVCRLSTTGRGIRLHETSMPGGQLNARDAIDDAMFSDDFR